MDNNTNEVHASIERVATKFAAIKRDTRKIQVIDPIAKKMNFQPKLSVTNGGFKRVIVEIDEDVKVQCGRFIPTNKKKTSKLLDLIKKAEKPSKKRRMFEIST